MSRFLSERFRALEAYTPGEQPQDKQYIKLNTNESPFPPAEDTIRAAAEAAKRLQLYPDPTAKKLREALATAYGVKSENIFVSNGSDDILNFSFMAFCDASHGALYPDVTYGFYPVYAELYGVPHEEIPLREDFTVCVDDYMKKRGMVVIANPNAPTGLALSVDEIERLVSSDTDRVVVIDEAYVDFGAESCLPLIQKYDNLLIVRTFSKSRSMAGARLGFAVAQAGLIADLEKIKYSTNPYDINSMTQAAGLAALANGAYDEAHCLEVARVREYVRAQLVLRGFKVTESVTNFLFAKPPKMGGESYYLALKSRGVLVRQFGAARIRDYVRVTIGTREQMDEFLKRTDEILSAE